MSNNKWNLVIDVALCNNCNNCLLATKDEYVGNDFPGYSAAHAPQGTGVLRIERTVRGAAAQVDTAYLPRMCNHCDNAPCLKQAGDAIRKRDDGIVIIDPIKARGRRDLVDACPYGAIVWNEAQQLPQNWIFDAHLLDAGWSQPRCAQACPTHAITAIKTSDEDMRSRQQQQQLRTLHEQSGHGARVYYRNLHRIDHCFVAGTVLQQGQHGDDCCSDASVSLHQSGREIGRITTDAFGQFKFDQLPKDSGAYTLKIVRGAAAPVTLDVTVQQSVTLPPIRLLTAG